MSPGATREFAGAVWGTLLVGLVVLIVLGCDQWYRALAGSFRLRRARAGRCTECNYTLGENLLCPECGASVSVSAHRGRPILATAVATVLGAVVVCAMPSLLAKLPISPAQMERTPEYVLWEFVGTWPGDRVSVTAFPGSGSEGWWGEAAGHPPGLRLEAVHGFPCVERVLVAFVDLDDPRAMYPSTLATIALANDGDPVPLPPEAVAPLIDLADIRSRSADRAVNLGLLGLVGACLGPLLLRCSCRIARACGMSFCTS